MRKRKIYTLRCTECNHTDDYFCSLREVNHCKVCNSTNTEHKESKPTVLHYNGVPKSLRK